MTQQQRQSQFSRVQSDEPSRGPSLSPPASPDATSPYKGPADEQPAPKSAQALDDEGSPSDMEQPYFSKAQSTLGAFAPVERPGDPFPEPEDPQAREFYDGPAEQAPRAVDRGSNRPDPEAQFPTAAGIVRAGMTVVDSYGHVLGVVADLDGERLRLASADPHQDGVSFLPVSLIDGIDDDRVLLGGRGDASFGIDAT